MFPSSAVISRKTIRLAKRLAQPFSKRNLLHAAHVMGPSLTALVFMGASSAVAHAQGTMDFSGAQTLMGTFKKQSGGSDGKRNTGSAEQRNEQRREPRQSGP